MPFLSFSFSFFQWDPSNSSAWIKFAELEAQLQDFARTRGIFELAVAQSPLSMPELLWKAYIDFEVEEGERQTARSLYERLIALSGHVKVWISYALFEAEPIPLPRAERDEEEEEEEEDGERKMVPGDPALARQVFERAYKDLKAKQLKSEVRWKAFLMFVLYLTFSFSFFLFLFSPKKSVSHSLKYGKLSNRVTVHPTTSRR